MPSARSWVSKRSAKVSASCRLAARSVKPCPSWVATDSNVSNLASRGEWEQNARDTVISLAHWTIGIAIGAVVIVAGLALLRRLRPRQAFIAAPPPVVTGEPEVSPVVATVEADSRLARRGLAGRLFGSGR